MTDKPFMSAGDVASILNISKGYAYKIMRDLNAELKAKGYITVSGRVNTQYFLEKTCYGTPKTNERS